MCIIEVKNGGTFGIHRNGSQSQKIRTIDIPAPPLLWCQSQIFENRTGKISGHCPRRLTSVAVTLEMHHQQQLLLPCLHTSWGACFSCLGTQSVSPIPRQTRNTCGPSHGRWLADQQHVCICILVTYQINLLGLVAGVIFSYYGYMVLPFWHNGSQYTI